MRQQGFSPQEMAKLDDAKAKSDQLVATETESMNAVKGLYRNAKGEYTVRGAPNLGHAQSLVTDAKYLQAIGSIMRPVDEFMAMVDQRTLQALQHAEARVATYSNLIIGTVAVLLAAVLTAAWTVFRRVVSPLHSLQRDITHVNSLRDLTRGSSVRIGDAIGDAAEAFNSLLSTFRDNVLRIQAYAQTLDDQSTQLRAASHQLSDNSS